MLHILMMQHSLPVQWICTEANVINEFLQYSVCLLQKEWISLICQHFLKNQTKHAANSPDYPNYDAHALALGSEGEDLQDIVCQDVSTRGLQLHWGQIPVNQSEPHTLCPLHQSYLKKEEKRKKETHLRVKALWYCYTN